MPAVRLRSRWLRAGEALVHRMRLADALHLGDSDLSVWEISALEAIQGGAATAKALAARLGVSVVNGHKAVDRLEKRHLVKRVFTGRARAGAEVVLTKVGTTHLEKAQALDERSIAKLQESLGPQAVDAIRLLDEVLARGAEPSSKSSTGNGASKPAEKKA